MERAGDLQVSGVLSGDAGEMIGCGSGVEHACVAVIVRIVGVAVVLERII